MISIIRLNRIRSSKSNLSRFILNHSNQKQRKSSISNLDSASHSQKNNTFHQRCYSTQTETSNLAPTLHEFISNLDSNPSSSSTSTLTLNTRIQSLRSHSKLTFLTLTDGSLPNNGQGIQAVISGKDSFNRLPQGVVVGSTVSLSGNLQQRQNKKGEKVWEFKVDSEREGSIRLIATSDNSTYPFPLTNQSSPTTTSNLSPNLARTLPHLRPRISRHSSLLRTRHRIEQGLENWFSRNDFVKCYPPILTTGDCEGAGEVFQVVKAVDEDPTTTIDEKSTISRDSKSQSIANSSDGSTPSTFFNQKTYLTVSTQLHLEALSQGLGRVWTSSPVFRAEGSMTNRHLAEFWMVEAEWNVGGIRFKEEQGRDQIQIKENAKDQETSQEIIEERKMLNELLDGTEKLLKSTMKFILGLEEENADRELDQYQRKRLENSRNEIKYLHETSTIENSINSTMNASSSSLKTLESFTETSQSWPRISYTEAIKILNQVSKETDNSSIDFSPPKWGESLSSSQEKYLSTNHFKSPLFVYDYPISIKPFYMRENSIRIKPTDLDLNLSTSNSHDEQSLLDDGRTVASFDLLIPGIGELVGGSVREERKDRIRNRMLELGLIKDSNPDFEKGEDEEEIGNQLDWYSKDLRNYGPFQTVGFGIGVERLLAWLTRTENIRDCTTWIRTRGNIKG